MISVAIMGHPDRQRYVAGLREQLPDAPVVMDDGAGMWATGRRALLSYDSSARHHLVVQDDAILCDAFLAGAEAVLAAVPEVPVSFYTGSVRPSKRYVIRAVADADEAGLPFLSMKGPLWGVAIALPVSLIDEVVADCDSVKPNRYDQPLTRQFQRRGIPCWYTLPSLVNHRVGSENPSLVPGRGAGPSRVAHAWIGERSPLDIDWSLGALTVTTGLLAVPKSS